MKVFCVIIGVAAIVLAWIEYLEWRDAQQVEPWRRVAMREHPESEERDG